ncbi:MAG TPA: hypothetical protein PKG90_03570 [Chitinophagaceae bacterium]|nr:hypothetical protein [Chitinophagaceae bacterium]
MKRKKIILYVFLSLLVIAGAVGFYFYKEYNRTHKDTAKLKPDYTVTATGLLKEFETNEQTSNKKYWDKVLSVEGMVKEVTKDDRGFYAVILGDTAAMSSVRCSIDSAHSNEAVTVSRGLTVTVKGICSGYNADEMLGSDIILVRSVIDKK